MGPRGAPRTVQWDKRGIAGLETGRLERAAVRALRKAGPTALLAVSVMRELVRIVVPGGLVLDAGTTSLATLAEDRRFIGIELHPDYAAIARRRLPAAIRFRERGIMKPTPLS